MILVTGRTGMLQWCSSPKASIPPVCIAPPAAPDDPYCLGRNTPVVVVTTRYCPLWHKALPLTARETYVSFSS